MAPEKHCDLSPQALDFVEKVSLHYENVYSVPRIGSRILALLLLIPEPMSIEDLECSLKVSHASISTNLRLLGALGYIQKVTCPGERTTYYRFLPRSRVRVLQERINHYQELKQVIQDAVRELDLEQEGRARLGEMLAWSDLAIKMNSGFIAEWEEHLRSDK
jgi:DNA-binding transcriptional regulator GbsR (MarR family)